MTIWRHDDVIHDVFVSRVSSWNFERGPVFACLRARSTRMRARFASSDVDVDVREGTGNWFFLWFAKEQTQIEHIEPKWHCESRRKLSEWRNTTENPTESKRFLNKKRFVKSSEIHNFPCVDVQLGAIWCNATSLSRYDTLRYLLQCMYCTVLYCKYYLLYLSRK